MCAPSAITTRHRTISAYDAVLSVRQRPANVAADIQRLIAGVPELVRSGRFRAQNNTNILAFLDNVSQSIGCRGMPTTVVLASDGIEDSDYARLDDPIRTCLTLKAVLFGVVRSWTYSGLARAPEARGKPHACAANGRTGPKPPGLPISKA